MDPRNPLNDPDALLSPSLLIYRALVRRNLETMIALARGADRLWPQVKAHKMAEIVRLSERLGIHKHKCATIVEAEMLAATGATDVLLVFPMVGPNVARLARLVKTYPEATFRTLVDHPMSALALSKGLEGIDEPLPVLIDLEVGMGRTGVAPVTKP
jgi:D-threonine aldolase